MLKLKIKRKGLARLDPGTKFQHFRNNHKDWLKLKNGEVIEIPDELFEKLQGVEKVSDYESLKKKDKKSRYSDINEVTSFDED